MTDEAEVVRLEQAAEDAAADKLFARQAYEETLRLIREGSDKNGE